MTPTPGADPEIRARGRVWCSESVRCDSDSAWLDQPMTPAAEWPTMTLVFRLYTSITSAFTEM